MLDVLIAFAIGAGVLAVGWWGIRYLTTQGPADPDPDDVIEVEATFVCSVCGMQLTVTHAQGDEVVPPRHCREEMQEA